MRKITGRVLNKIAANITKRVGTVGFFIIIFTWTVLWLGWNSLAPIALRFDPFPAFVLWLFLSNMIQIFLMPLLMIGQNAQTRSMENLMRRDYKLDADSLLQLKRIEALLEELSKALAKNK